VRGIINLRGQVISVIDLRLKLHLSPTPPTPETAIIILDLPLSPVGVVVDSVDRVQTLRAAEISAVPSSERSPRHDGVVGIVSNDEGLTLILDIRKAIAPEEHGFIAA
jgi:purine-binding chemotaxis protein CheW